MFPIFIGSLFKKKSADRFLSVDIGASSIKLMELDIAEDKPRLVSAALCPTPGGSLNSNAIVKPEQVASSLRALIESNEITATKATFSIPGPAAFTKKISISGRKLEDLQENIAYEAANYIPHKVDAVYLDFQIIRTQGSTMDILLVAVKNEIILSFLQALELAGLEPAIADVDYFALENAFELNYPESRKKTVALIDVGGRYSGVNILQDGHSLFTGDVGVGGRLYTDALCEACGLSPKDAEQAKMGTFPEGADANLIKETLERTTEHIAAEIQRQLGFFWNAAAADKAIEELYVTGGGSLVSGFIEELSTKTGVACQRLNPFLNVSCGEGFDPEYLNELAPSMAISVGLALRRFGDKVHAVA